MRITKISNRDADDEEPGGEVKSCPDEREVIG
jgi:hypothetical protein